jgi:calcium-binding protein CML
MKLRLRSRSSSSRSSRRNSGTWSDIPAPLVKELTATFKVFDRDGDGRISKTELVAVLSSLDDGRNVLKDAEVDEMMMRADADGDGFIDLDEFIRFNTTKSTGAANSAELSRTLSGSSSGGISEEELSADSVDDEEKRALQSAFDVFDVDRNGFISADELHRVMVSLGDKHTTLEDCRCMIRSVDRDGDQMVDFREFQFLMSSPIFCS